MPPQDPAETPRLEVRIDELRTVLLRDAARAGCQTIGGLDMLVAQAEQQFSYWTGEPPAPDVMRAAAERRLAEFSTDEAHVI